MISALLLLQYLTAAGSCRYSGMLKYGMVSRSTSIAAWDINNHNPSISTYGNDGRIWGPPARSVMVTVRCGGDLPVKVNVLHCIRDYVFFFSHKLAKVAVISGPFFLLLSQGGHSGSYVDIRSCRYTSRLALPSRIIIIRGANLSWYKSPLCNNEPFIYGDNNLLSLFSLPLFSFSLIGNLLFHNKVLNCRK
ncbi:hypothetical protein B9Z19DRAFT_1096618 [Tuber borchii]|uniref:Uncharacterized protein n=1 Tax=Tuber borchii TaxID=42251 RepID=A0A2T6ZBD2_TUBBO|nr:hypothetical protein B9Z19DRAFT_1096618 [Tuber borchii]